MGEARLYQRFDSPPTLSIVTSLYSNAERVEEFYERSVKAAETITNDFEIILVNDGSPDESLVLAVALHERDNRVKVIDLARNFGQHPAMRAGLDYASGELVYVLDGDLEEDPAWLVRFYEKLCLNPDADVVYGVQERREGAFVKNTCGKLYYKFSFFFF